MLIQSIGVLDPSMWPTNCPLTHGEIAFLCDLFQLDSPSARKGLQEFIDNVRVNGHLEVPPRLKDLSKAIQTLVVSTADCERGFSQMNTLATPA